MDSKELKSLTNQYLDVDIDILWYEDYMKIVDLLSSHNILYYDQHMPIITDVEFDQLFDLCKNIEYSHPDRISASSPTQKLVWQDPNPIGFKKIRHRKPLLSLENTYNKEELRERYDSIKRMTDKIGVRVIWDFIIEPKYDGISIELIYIDGKFTQGITRGDGLVWEDITNNIFHIKGIPSTIDHKEEIHLRWEIVMPKSHFEAINKERSMVWLPLFSNPRNATSGIVKQLQTPIEIQKKLVCYIYDII